MMVSVNLAGRWRIHPAQRLVLKPVQYLVAHFAEGMLGTNTEAKKQEKDGRQDGRHVS